MFCVMALVNNESRSVKKRSAAVVVDAIDSSRLISVEPITFYIQFRTKYFIHYTLIILQFAIPVLCQKSKPSSNNSSSFSPSTESPSSVGSNATFASLVPRTSPPASKPTTESSSGEPTKIANSSSIPSSFASSVPTPEPTISEPPSGSPTIAISLNPTATVSDPPSNVPTLISESFSRSRLRQRFDVEQSRIFNTTEQTSFVYVVQNYTELFAPVSRDLLPYISTECQIIDQLHFNSIGNGRDISYNEVDYFCSYDSVRVDVTNFTVLYAEYVNNNLTSFANNLSAADVPVLQALTVYVNQIQSPAPSISPEPTEMPTLQPSQSFVPTQLPTSSPSMLPSYLPKPTKFPTQFDPPIPPTPLPTNYEKERRLGVGTIASIVVLGGVAVLLCFLHYYMTWKKKNVYTSRPNSEMAPSSNVPDVLNPPRIRSEVARLSSLNEESDIHQDVVVSPTESLLTNTSLLSTGESGLSEESDDEYDGTQELQDEFDKYKDQNLEQFRDGVENTVAGMEGVMSAAVTMAHMIDDVAEIDESELWWGCDRPCSGVDIEASALFEVCDWLKRNESAPPERRRVFMQEILNKMVTSVKNGVLNADDGSRTIHESAAVLGLHLAEPLPVTTVVLSGMRKTVTADEMSRSIREFGDVDVAAVASGLRGFGIVRFRRQKSVERVMRRYKTGEIVIQDVAVQMKVLMATGMVDSRAPEIH